MAHHKVSKDHCIVSLAKSFDIFGNPVVLKVKDQPTYNSLLGALISIGIYIFSYYSFLSMVFELYNRTSPNIVTRIEYTPHPQEFYLTPQDFQFQFVVTNERGFPVFNLPNATIYTPQFQNCFLYNEQDVNGKINKIEKCSNIPIVPCPQSNIPNQIKQVFKRYLYLKQQFQIQDDQYNLLSCADFESFKDKKLSLKDTQSSSNFSYIRIQLNRCVNETGNPYVCASQEQIEQNLKSGYMAINYFDRLLDQQQNGNPYITINKVNYFTIDSTSYQKKVFIYFRHSIMETIENFLYYSATNYTHHVLQYEYKEEFNDPSINLLKSGEFFKMSFLIDDRTVHYYRSYDNLLNIIGSITGTHGIIVFFFSLIIGPFNQLLLNREIVNSLFNFEQKQKNKNNKVNPEQKIQHPLYQLQTLQQLQIREGRNQDAKELRQIIERRDTGLKLTCTEQLTILFGGLKREQLNKGLEKMAQKLDIIFIIKKLIEIDKLKRLLLNEDQIKLFDYIPKPIVPIPISDRKVLVEKSGGIDYFSKEKTFNEQIIEALQAYKGICKKQVDNPLDQRLIALINEDMKELFDKYIQLEEQSRSQINHQASSELPMEFINLDSHLH